MPTVTGPSGSTEWSIRRTQAFQRRLMEWFSRRARQLPWRGVADPYRIWVSEIMLQQTQVATVVGYYERFVERFPSVQHLAAAPLEEVLRYWEGLGYYRRARQMWQAAQRIVADHGGHFPQTLSDLVQLPGIGRYTAGAILSIAFNQPVAILEANTERLFTRLLAIEVPVHTAATRKRLWQFAQELVPDGQAGQFNQAVMELGSQVCRPRPLCDECPVSTYCAAFAQGKERTIPAQCARKDVESIVDVAVVLCTRSHPPHVLLRQYQENERWAGLWDFPRWSWQPDKKSGRPEPPAAEQVVEQFRTLTCIEPKDLRYVSSLRHGVTRYRITLHAYCGFLPEGQPRRVAAPYEWFSAEELDRVPFPSPARKLVAKLGLARFGDGRKGLLPR